MKTNDASLVSAANRLHLAEDVIRQASDLTNICQGRNKTCNVTAVESRIYAKYPAQAAALVADIATTGKFITASGNTISLQGNNLTPDSESETSPPGSDKRSYASQLFQITAVNVYWQSKENNTRYGKDPSNVNMEGLTAGSNFSQSPRLKLSNLEFISNQISGNIGESGYLVSRNYPTHPQVLPASHARELLKQLQKMEKAGKLPAILLVKTEPEMGDKSNAQAQAALSFTREAQGEPSVDFNGNIRVAPTNTSEKDADHVVTVRKIAKDYRTGKVYVFVDGEWGKRQHGWVDVDTLFNYLD